MNKGIAMFLWMVLGSVVFFAQSVPVFSQEASRITKEEVKKMLGNPEMVIIDVRQATDWNASEVKIKGAVREDPQKVSSWMANYPKDKTLVFYCA